MRLSARTTVAAVLVIVGPALSAQEAPREIRWAIVDGFQPMTFINEAGEPDGFLYQLYSRLLQDSSFSYELVVAPFSEIYAGLLSGTVDLFVPLQRNAEREDLFYWPDQVALNGWGQLFVRAGQTVLTVEDLRGQRIGIIRNEAQGSAFLDLMDGLGISVVPVVFAEFLELLDAVTSGDVAGGVAFSTLVVGNPQIRPTAVVFAPAPAYATTALTNEVMIPVVNELSAALGELMSNPDSWYWELREQWLQSQPVQVRTVPRWLFGLLLVGLIVTSALAALTIVLRLELLRRSRALAELNRTLEQRIQERTEKLNQTVATIWRSERVALTSRLVAGIAHQINTPIGISLTALTFGRSQLELVNVPQEGGENSVLEGVSESMQLVEANIRRAAELVTRFRSISSSHVGGREELVNLGELVGNTVFTMDAAFQEAGHRVRFRAPDKNVWTWPMSISEILMNLMVNSLDHAFPDDFRGHAEITVSADASTVSIVYQDDGSGMALDVAEHARDPFFTTDRTGRHAGLGLNIVQNLVEESLHGEIELKTAPGEGVEVRIRFPVRTGS